MPFCRHLQHAGMFTTSGTTKDGLQKYALVKHFIGENPDRSVANRA